MIRRWAYGVCCVAWLTTIIAAGGRCGRAAEDPLAAASRNGAPPADIELPPEKFQAAGIATERVVPRALQARRIVPGRLHYDEARHVEVRAATDGVLRQVLAKPSDLVTAGQVLAVLASHEVGSTRADVLQRGAALQVAQRDRDWERSTSDSLARLAKSINERRSVAQIREDFHANTLGAHGDRVLMAYSRYLLADALLANVAGMADSGAVAGRTIRERASERDSAAVALKSILEQSTFEAQQACRRAEAAAEDAERRLNLARQQLTTLLGYDDPVTSGESAAEAPQRLSVFDVRAPFAGTIERNLYAVSERVRQGDSLFVLADTTRLWVAADLREREWNALSLTAGELITVTTPALPGQQFSAEVFYVGREVSAETNAVPLIATIDNSSGWFRPGLFVQVSVPVSQRRRALAVPEQAVCEHEGMRFVFVEQSPTRFRRVNVQTGSLYDGWYEVISGLHGDEAVVTKGAFALKSALLLESEDEG